MWAEGRVDGMNCSSRVDVDVDVELGECLLTYRCNVNSLGPSSVTAGPVAAAFASIALSC